MSRYYRTLQNFTNLNLLTFSEGNITTYPTKGNVTDALTSIVGFDNSVYFDTNTVTRYAYKVYTPLVAGIYNISCFVEMDDGGAPILGTSGSNGHFAFVINESVSFLDMNITLISGNVYRVSSNRSISTSIGNFGVVKYTWQSARKFKISGIQLTLGADLKPYQKTI